MDKSSIFNFTYEPSVADFAVTKHAYLAARSNASFGFIATSAYVLDTADASDPRVLLLQRAASDSMPNKWEPPGGACDDGDVSILHGAARELKEETGLEAARITGPVGEPHFFTSRSGKSVCRFGFIIFVKDDTGNLPIVTLDPKEHQRFVWATRSEVEARKAGNVNLEFTKDEVYQTVLLALRPSKT